MKKKIISSFLFVFSLTLLILNACHSPFRAPPDDSKVELFLNNHHHEPASDKFPDSNHDKKNKTLIIEECLITTVNYFHRFHPSAHYPRRFYPGGENNLFYDEEERLQWGSSLDHDKINLTGSVEYTFNDKITDGLRGIYFLTSPNNIQIFFSSQYELWSERTFHTIYCTENYPSLKKFLNKKDGDGISSCVEYGTFKRTYSFLTEESMEELKDAVKDLIRYFVVHPSIAENIQSTLQLNRHSRFLLDLQEITNEEDKNLRAFQEIIAENNFNQFILFFVAKGQCENLFEAAVHAGSKYIKVLVDKGEIKNEQD